MIGVFNAILRLELHINKRRYRDIFGTADLHAHFSFLFIPLTKFIYKLQSIKTAKYSSELTSSTDRSLTILHRRAPTNESPAPVVSTALTWNPSTVPRKFYVANKKPVIPSTKPIENDLNHNYFQWTDMKHYKELSICLFDRSNTYVCLISQNM